MKLDNLRSAWAHFKAVQKLDMISEKELNDMIEQDTVKHRKRLRPSMLKFSLIHTCLILICQSC